jgi:hypothetical protein
MTTCLHLRHRNGRVTVLRTVDLFDQIRYRHRHQQEKTSSNKTKNNSPIIDAETVIEGKSILKNCRIRLHIQTRNTAQQQLPINKKVFHQLHIPTRDGFSNSPGCQETYRAYAKLEYWNSYWNDHQALSSPSPPDEVYKFPLTAYEFGGTFIGQTLITNMPESTADINNP